MFRNRKLSLLAIAYDISCSKHLLTTAYTSHWRINAGNMWVIIPIQARRLHACRNELSNFRLYCSLVSIKNRAAFGKVTATCCDDLLRRKGRGCVRMRIFLYWTWGEEATGSIRLQPNGVRYRRNTTWLHKLSKQTPFIAGKRKLADFCDGVTQLAACCVDITTPVALSRCRWLSLSG